MGNRRFRVGGTDSDLGVHGAAAQLAFVIAQTGPATNLMDRAAVGAPYGTLAHAASDHPVAR